MSLNDFEQIKQLGKGAFGTVALVKRKADNQKYAMKTVKIAKMNTKDQLNALNEVRVLASLNHVNVIDYKEAFYTEESSTLNIIMEHAEEGDLQSKIKQAKINKTYLPETDIWSYLIQIILGVKALHDKKIMHRDLKSANVFLMKNGTIKIGDLNVSKVVKMGFLSTQTGTPYYASPEVWSEKPYDYKSDLWSVGCIAYELCALRPPFRGQTLEHLFKCVTKGVFDPIPDTYSKELQQIISLLLQVNPAKRASCDSFLQNPIIVKKIDSSCMMVCHGRLLNTIKLPYKLEDINEILPKMTRYGNNLSLQSKVPFLLEKKAHSSTTLVSVPMPESQSSSKSDKSIKSNKSVPPKVLRSNICAINGSASKKLEPILNIRALSPKNSVVSLVSHKVNIKRLSSGKDLISRGLNVGQSKRVGNHISPLAVIDLSKRSPSNNAKKFCNNQIRILSKENVN